MITPPINLDMVSTEGYIRQHGQTWWVWVRAKAGRFTFTQITDPDGNGNVVYVRQFLKKPIFLDLNEAKRQVFGNDHIFLIGATGYTDLDEKTCRTWGIQPGAYELAAERMITDLIRSLQLKFPGVRVGLVDGAAQLGIDKAVIATAEKNMIPHLGFTCPRYLMYVEDDQMPVFCGQSKTEYLDRFVQTLHVLLGMNGRATAFEHDMRAAILYRKGLILINILKSISLTGGPVAYTEDGSINDALSAFQTVVRNLSHLPSESFDALTDRVTGEVIDLARLVLPPRIGFNLTE